jgi:hypothetical protein
MARILHFTYNGRPLTVDFESILNVEAIEIEKVTSHPFLDFFKKLDEYDVPSITALVALALRREGEDVKFRDVQFPLSEWGKRRWEDDSEDVGDDEQADPPTPGVEAGEASPAND